MVDVEIPFVSFNWDFLFCCTLVASAKFMHVVSFEKHAVSTHVQNTIITCNGSMLNTQKDEQVTRVSS